MAELSVLHLSDIPINLRLLGLHGRKQSGKDTFYQSLDDAVRCHHMSFANPLKDAAENIFGGHRDNYHGTEDQKNEIAEFWAIRLGNEWSSYRKIMQRFGTEVCRENIHWQIWVWATELRLIQAYDRGDLKDGDFVVWADVRYDNEAFAVRNMDGVVLHIINTNQPDETDDGHSSEMGIDPGFVNRVCRFSSANENRNAAQYLPEEFDTLRNQPFRQWNPELPFTVLGYLHDTGERWSTTVYDYTPEGAENRAILEHPEQNVVVCGVVAGTRDCIGSHRFVRHREDVDAISQ